MRIQPGSRIFLTLEQGSGMEKKPTVKNLKSPNKDVQVIALYRALQTCIFFISSFLENYFGLPGRNSGDPKHEICMIRKDKASRNSVPAYRLSVSSVGRDACWAVA